VNFAFWNTLTMNKFQMSCICVLFKFKAFGFELCRRSNVSGELAYTIVFFCLLPLAAPTGPALFTRQRGAQIAPNCALCRCLALCFSHDSASCCALKKLAAVCRAEAKRLLPCWCLESGALKARTGH